MPANQFTNITTQGFGSRIIGAIVGVPVGILLIIGACLLLYWNEGRVDYSKIASQSVPVQADRVDSSRNGKFVSVTGSLSGQPLSDGSYLQPGSYVALQRIVEEYAWVEDQQTSSHNNLGGSQTSTTTYTYKQAWTDDPADASTFKYPDGHQNPKKPLNDLLTRANNSKIGAYGFDPQTVKLPPLQDVTLSSANVVLPVSMSPAATTGTLPPGSDVSSAAPTPTILTNLSLSSPQYLFAGKGNLQTPQVGDVRISYKALASGVNATVFGQLNNGKLEAYTDSKNHTLYDLLLGDRQTAIAGLHSQYVKEKWLFRAIGVGLIWIGLMMLLAPLNILLDFIPIAGAIGSGLTFVITLPLALVIGGTVIVIGYTLHHLLAMLLAVPLVFVIIAGLLKLVKRGRGLPKGGGSPPLTSPPTTSSDGPPPAAGNSGSLFPSDNGAAAANVPTVTPTQTPPPAYSPLPPIPPAPPASPPTQPVPPAGHDEPPAGSPTA